MGSHGVWLIDGWLVPLWKGFLCTRNHQPMTTNLNHLCSNTYMHTHTHAHMHTYMCMCMWDVYVGCGCAWEWACAFVNVYAKYIKICTDSIACWKYSYLQTTIQGFSSPKNQRPRLPPNHDHLRNTVFLSLVFSSGNSHGNLGYPPPKLPPPNK